MKAHKRIGLRPVSLPLSADDIVEFHAARLLLLIHLCGVSGRIDGLTKMAKLDFFARYPDFFEVARAAQSSSKNLSTVTGPAIVREAIESAMVRHHYGPWDKRYYHVLAYLEAKGLITVTKEGNAYRIALTDLGKTYAKALEAKPSFAALVVRMKEIKSVFGNKTGNAIKELIYCLFDEEVGRRPKGEVIQ